MTAWVSLLQSVAVIGILVVTLGLMVGAVQPGDAAKNIKLTLGITVALIVLRRLDQGYLE